MKLIKVSSGLLEADNFFLASPFPDFAGSAKISRDISTGTLKLTSNDKIERAFSYSNFVIEVKKENHPILSSTDYYRIYVGNDDDIYGIHDDITEESQYWKLISIDNYIQAYCSKDGINWGNLGGSEIKGPLTKQGFIKNSDNTFTLDNYQIYSSPFVTLQNFNEGVTCELYDLDNKLIKTRTFDSNMECKIFLDSNKLKGYFVFKDSDNIIFTSETMILEYGDVWINSPYNLEILYLGSLVTNEDPALLKNLEEMISIKNVDNQSYNNLTLGTTTSGDNLIQLSLDGNTYSDTLTIDLLPNEEKFFYVKITKSAVSPYFRVRNFQLIVNE